jgi:hypothetical protein
MFPENTSAVNKYQSEIGTPLAASCENSLKHASKM